MALYTILPDGTHSYGKAVCPVCGKEFEMLNSRQMYCSKQCRSKRNNAYANAQRAKQRKDAGVYNIKEVSRANPIKRTCIICGKEFLAGSKSAKYCSETCHKEGAKIARRTFTNRQLELGNACRAKFGMLGFGKSKPGKPVNQFGYKLWDDNDPECKAVTAYLKTVEPIDWAEENRILERERLERLRSEAADPKSHKGNYVRRNLCTKHGNK